MIFTPVVTLPCDRAIGRPPGDGCDHSPQGPEALVTVAIIHPKALKNAPLLHCRHERLQMLLAWPESQQLFDCQPLRVIFVGHPDSIFAGHLDSIFAI
jgi:hypothetical protein